MYRYDCTVLTSVSQPDLKTTLRQTMYEVSRERGVKHTF